MPEKRKPLIELVRISAREHWFPEHFYEVVAHRAAGVVVVTVVATRPEKSSAHIEQFDCVDHEPCVRDMRLWLARLAQDAVGADERVKGWADQIAQRIGDSLFER